MMWCCQQGGSSCEHKRRPLSDRRFGHGAVCLDRGLGNIFLLVDQDRQVDHSAEVFLESFSD